MRTVICFFACLVCAAVVAVGVLRVWRAPIQEGRVVERPLVLAGHVATYSLASALAEGTTIDVAWAWPQGAVWADQREVAVSARAAEVVAVVTLRQSAPEDALFAAVRAVRLAVIEIDATVSEDQRTSVVRVPVGNAGAGKAEKGAGGETGAKAKQVETGVAVAPLSLGNATRMAEGIARDFARLCPGEAGRVTENLRRVKERLFRLRAEAEATLAGAESLDVVLFSPEWGALAEELGLAVRAAGDAEARVVVASRALSSAEVDGVTGAGVGVGKPVTVVVLDALGGGIDVGDAGEVRAVESYFRVMEENLRRVMAALVPAKVVEAAGEPE